MPKIKGLLTEILRPKKLEDVILLDRVKAQIFNNDLSQNFLLCGVPGGGKTSLAKVLAKERATLYINASAERGVETVRTKIQDFCQVKDMNLNKTDRISDFKVVFLDEFDYATEGMFFALRATMEKYQSSVRFIATCNYLNKINEAIQSRFLILNFNPVNEKEEQELTEKYLKRIKTLLKKLDIKYENDEVLLAFIAEYFPDFRSILKQIQYINDSEDREITSESIRMIDSRLEQLFEMTLESPDPAKNYSTLINAVQNKHTDVFTIFSTDYVSWLLQRRPGKAEKIPQIVSIIADQNYKSNFIVDPSLSVLAMFYQIQLVINSK